MRRFLILGSFGAAVGAAIATFGLNVGLAFSAPLNLPTSLFRLVNTIAVVPLAGAMVGAAMAWLAVRWRNPLAQAGLGAGLALVAILFSGAKRHRVVTGWRVAVDDGRERNRSA